MSLTLYFVRHGETIYSQSGGYCGDLDPDLTPAGHQMAASLAEALHSVPWEAIYVSPKKRTIATATPLCNAIEMQLQLREGLREMSFGKWEGKSLEEIKQQYFEDYVHWMTEPSWNPPTGGETAVQVASRASLVITEIKEKFPSGNVLVVSHKTTIRTILCSLLGIDLGRYRDRIDMPTASLSMIKFDKYGPLLQRLGDRSHMSEELRSRPGT